MLQYRAAILILLGWVVIALAGRPSRASPKYTDWRLPRSVLPRQYKLRLLPFLDGNFTTSGYVEILLECMQDTQLVVLHMSEITIAKEGLQIHDLIESRRVNIQSYIEDKTRQLLVIGTKNETLRKGMFYRLTIQFVSQLNENLNGFYRANYVDGGVKKYLATTQFSPTDARKAFPCFDEPGMKARFQITLGRKKSRKSHSNMPIKQTIPHEKLADYVWDEYETTLPMSTYILAFIVSEFEGLDPIIEADSKLHNRVRFQFWARPSSLKQTEYARTLGPKVLEFFETFFNISFPLPKLDMFAIPDFAVGAMENWGLITYRETSLLYDPLRSSSLNKQRVATVIAHELAHQWFGNLVTMAWWSDLWLKEGFASYLEFVGSDAADASLQVGQQFTVEKMHVVFSVDALATSHPMSMPVNKRNEVNELFDSIPYAKGPSVIRMLAAFLGQNNFRNGLTLYLNNKKYQNAVQDDLWTAFDGQSNNNTTIDLPASVETIMNSWSLQSGYPIVTVRRDYENQSAILTQERFYLLPNQNSSDDFPLWWIPLTFTSDFKATYSAWMMGTEDGIELELAASPTDWIIFNVDQLGYYRVNYDDRNWKMITDQLQENHLEVPVLNRAQILDDGLNIARIGEVSYRIILELTRYLRSERDYVPWKAALSAFDYVDRMLYSTAGKDKFREYLKWIITPVFQEIGFNQKKNDSHLTILNRDQILSWACKLGIPECVKNATALYKSWMNQSDNEELIHSNYKRTIICAAIANNGDEEWDFALERYLSTDLSSEKETLLYALGCSTNPQALNTLLEWSLEAKSGIRRQDSQTVFASVSRNPLGKDMVFDFALKNWDRMVKAFPSLYVLGRLFDSIATSLNTEDHLKNLMELSQGGKGDLGTATRSVNQAVERTQINLNWMKKHSKTVTSLANSWSKFKTFAPNLS